MKKFRLQFILYSALAFLAIAFPADALAQPEIQKHRAELKDRVERFRQIRQEADERPWTLQSTAPKSSNFELRKDLLLRAIDSLTKHAELMQERLIHFPIVQENLRVSLDGEIRTDIEQLEGFRIRVQNATTLEELRGLTSELQTHRKETIEEKIRKLMVLAQVELFEQRVLETASARAILIQNTLSDAPELVELLQNASSKITETSLLLQTLKKDIRSKEIDDKTMSEVRSTLKAATNTMRDVYKIFRAITNSSSPR